MGKIEALNQLFFSEIIQKQSEIKNSGNRLVHYTSATTFIQILENKEIWLRSATLMNDFQEIERGIKAVIDFFGVHNNSSEQFWSFLDRCHPGLSNEIQARYDFSMSDLRHNTFIMSLSVHLDHEDDTGRLSMWRAYAPKDGVALVMDAESFFREENKLDVFSYPVLYWGRDEIERRFQEIVRRFIENEKLISEMKLLEVVEFTLDMLSSFAICLKHPGFAEEQEMRVVYRPRWRPSKAAKKLVKALGTTPQIVYSVPLTEEYNTEFRHLLNRVIIGPSPSSGEVASALSEVMNRAGIPDISNKVFISDIPLRV